MLSVKMSRRARRRSQARTDRHSAFVRPDRMGIYALGDGQTTVVAVEAGQGTVRRREDGRENIEGDPRVVVRADERTGHALLRTSTEITERLTGDDVVTDLDRGRAVQVGRPSCGAPRRRAVNAELLAVRVAGRSVAVVEDDLEAAVRQSHRVGALVEVALMLVQARGEEIAEEAQRVTRPADLLGRREGKPVGRWRSSRRSATPRTIRSAD